MAVMQAVPFVQTSHNEPAAGPEDRATALGLDFEADGSMTLRDDYGNIVAQLPDTGDRDAQLARARLYAEAPRLLELVRFALRNLGDGRPGLGSLGRDELLRAYLRCCSDIVHEISPDAANRN